MSRGQKGINQVRSALSKLLSTGFFNIVGSSILNRIITFLSGMILVRVLSKSEYGSYSYALNIINYFILINGLGASSCVVQFCVEQRDEQRAEEAYRVICWIGIIWDVFLTLAILFVGLFVTLPMEGANELMLWLAPFPFVSHLVELQQQRLRSQFRTSQYAWATNINTTLVVIFSVGGALLASSVGLSIGRTFAMIATIFVVLSLFRVTVFKKPHHISKELIVDVVKMSSTVCATNAVSQALILVGTSLVGSVIANPEITATYSTSTTIPFALSFIPSMIITYVMPYFVQNACNRRWVLRSWALCTLAVFIIAVPIWLICIIFSDELISLIFGLRYLDSVPSFCVLMTAFLISAPLRTVSGNILASHRKYVFNLGSNIVSLVICFVVSFSTLARFGIVGASIGYLAAMMSGSLINIVGIFLFAGKPNRRIER